MLKNVTFVVLQKYRAMARITTTPSIESQITSYVSRLSLAKQKAVLTLLQQFDEDSEYRDAFEKEWANAIPLEKARQHSLNTVRTLFKEKSSRKKRSSSVLR